jgi:hypothetical protein
MRYLAASLTGTTERHTTLTLRQSKRGRRLVVVLTDWQGGFMIGFLAACALAAIAKEIRRG